MTYQWTMFFGQTLGPCFKSLPKKNTKIKEAQTQIGNLDDFRKALEAIPRYDVPSPFFIPKPPRSTF